jgi:hypothetical protein
MTATTPHGFRRTSSGAEDVLHHVQAFDDLGPALGHVLAALVGHEYGE